MSRPRRAEGVAAACLVLGLLVQLDHRSVAASRRSSIPKLSGVEEGSVAMAKKSSAKTSKKPAKVCEGARPKRSAARRRAAANRSQRRSINSPAHRGGSSFFRDDDGASGSARRATDAICSAAAAPARAPVAGLGCTGSADRVRCCVRARGSHSRRRQGFRRAVRRGRSDLRRHRHHIESRWIDRDKQAIETQVTFEDLTWLRGPAQSSDHAALRRR